MTIICESKKDLSKLLQDYKIVKWNELKNKLESIVNTGLIWTIEDFDDYCTVAYNKMILDDNMNTQTELEKLLRILVKCCDKIILFYWFDDIEKTISSITDIFKNEEDFISYVKSSIYEDYRCMFNCIYITQY